MNMHPLTDPVKNLIDTKCYANVATLMPDGSPQVTQTWVDHDGDLVLINTYEGSQKHRNVLRNPKVALDICDPSEPFRVAMIRGQVGEVTTDGANAHIDKMAKKYLGQDKYPMRQRMRRVLIKIEPIHVTAPFVDNSRWQAWRNQQS